MLEYIFFPLLIIVSLLVIVTGWRLVVALGRFRIKRQMTAAIDPPTVSVCIPVRNEMRVMTECLERVLASDYPKIEVIVFDDGSTDDTSVLVRSFAHVGVRFVPGRELPAGWLGKNHALSILASEASGSKLLFLDVDTQINVSTISQLMGCVTTEQLAMVSVLPIRRDGWSPSVWLGYLRYFWELVIAGRSMPATSSGLWLIDREVLAQCGGFAAYAHDVRPEQRLAEQLGTSRYHCLLGTDSLGVAEQKPLRSQREAARRLYYPIVGGRPLAGIAAVVMLLLYNVPFVTMIVGAVSQHIELTLWAELLVIVMMAIYALYTRRMWRRGWWLGALLLPLLLLRELYLLGVSLSGYATHTVTWKGRSVTAPTARADYFVIDK